MQQEQQQVQERGRVAPGATIDTININLDPIRKLPETTRQMIGEFATLCFAAGVQHAQELHVNGGSLAGLDARAEAARFVEKRWSSLFGELADVRR